MNPPSLPEPERPPYRQALLAALLVLAGYIATLAPTVTFWDAGEFIAAARILGIPHPPGTPLFVLIAHLWGSLLPFGEFAARLNLLSAVLSSVGAGCFFLVVHETLAGATEYSAAPAARLLRVGGALAAALIAGFSFTQWQNSNETEVYAVATATVGLICWLGLRWRAARGSDRGTRLLLLVLYLAGLSIGNHLLALLAGPAVVAFLWATLRSEPAAALADRRAEWAQLAVVAGTWALLIGSGLGSTLLTVLGLVAYLAALLLAIGSGQLPFALLALAVSAVGVTSYLYLYIRSGQHPILNEAAPDNLQALLAVVRRAQYPVRTPLDDPTVPHGPDNPGRTLCILGLQLFNYFQYFDWQWASGVTRTVRLWALDIPWRLPFTLLFFSLGMRGALLQRRSDRAGWWLLFMLWLTTGLALILYMNFKPGFSVGYNLFPNPDQHEVRERDYFFVLSFVVWGLWAGIGLVALARNALAERGRFRTLLAAGVLSLGVLPFALNYSAATRRGPDARLAADFAYDLLNSVPPYGILFTYGDNDTFPLWWAQEVAGLRRDVTVVCLALAQTQWYMRQLRDQPIRDFDETTAPSIWRGLNAVKPSWPIHTMTDAEIAEARPVSLPEEMSVKLGPVTRTYPAGTVLLSNDILVLRVLQANFGRRPVAWAITTGRDFNGLDDHLLQQGLVQALEPTPPDSTARFIDSRRVFGSLLDVPTTDRLLWETYRYADLLGAGGTELEPTSRGIANNLGIPFAQLAYAYRARGDSAAASRNAERAAVLTPSIRQ